MIRSFHLASGVLLASFVVGCNTPVFVGPREMDAAVSDASHTGDVSRRDVAPVDTGSSPTPAPMMCADAAAHGDAASLDFWPTSATSTAAPPVSGGTLLVTHDDTTAVASDPDRDAVWLVDLATQHATEVPLESGDEPGRIAEDAAGRIHVALRRGGAVVDIDVPSATVTARRAVCAAPRGIAYYADTDSLYVACVDGTLATLPAAGGAVSETHTFGGLDDLRDVVVDTATNDLLVSRFRSAQVIVFDPRAGTSSVAVAPRDFAAPAQIFGADVAWRLVRHPRGGAVMLHQYAGTLPICPSPGGYGANGSAAFLAAFSQVDATSGTPAIATSMLDHSPMIPMTLAVDIAVSPADGTMAIAAAGAAADNGMVGLHLFSSDGSPSTERSFSQVVAVAYTSSGTLVAQTRDPPTLEIVGAVSPVLISLGPATPHDTGHQIFHTATAAGVACAGCHPEGGDDGHIWNFGGEGPRRTQNLRGGVIATAPFHWDGHFTDINSLLADVYSGRMSGPTLTSDQVLAVQHWLDTIPPLPHAAPTDPAAVARGQALFDDAVNVGCINCHSGPHFTNNATVPVGTGGMFQVPSLIGVAFRAPYMHDGCAHTLTERFTYTLCGGGDAHGHTSQLTAAQIADLVAYLETL